MGGSGGASGELWEALGGDPTLGGHPTPGGVANCVRGVKKVTLEDPILIV